jgi:NIMA (never in mitosis gene a)-related kinase
LGKGSYSTVYRVERISDGMKYALKEVKLYDYTNVNFDVYKEYNEPPSGENEEPQRILLTDKERENSLNEVRVLASIKNNKNVIKFHDAFIEDDQEDQKVFLCIVLELATKGDLYQKIHKYKEEKM